MKTRLVATVTASLLVGFLMALGPPAGAGQSPITELQFSELAGRRLTPEDEAA